MPAKKSRQLALDKRRRQVADLYQQGYTQTEIAEKVGVGQRTVCADILRVREQWRTSMVRDFDMAREVELKKLDRIEKEAWTAWEQPQQPAQSAQFQDGSDKATQRKVRNKYGDPRFLARDIMESLDQAVGRSVRRVFAEAAWLQKLKRRCNGRLSWAIRMGCRFSANGCITAGVTHV